MITVAYNGMFDDISCKLRKQGRLSNLRLSFLDVISIEQRQARAPRKETKNEMNSNIFFKIDIQRIQFVISDLAKLFPMMGPPLHIPPIVIDCSVDMVLAVSLTCTIWGHGFHP